MLYTEEIYIRCSLNVIVEGDVFYHHDKGLTLSMLKCVKGCTVLL